MAKRSPNHSFNKQQKERKRLEKAKQKNQRRELKKQQSTGDASLATDDSPANSLDDTATIETDASIDPETRSSNSE